MKKAFFKFTKVITRKVIDALLSVWLWAQGKEKNLKDRRRKND